MPHQLSHKNLRFFLFDCFQGYIASYTHLPSTLLNFQDFRAKIPDLDKIERARVSIVLCIGLAIELLRENGIIWIGDVRKVVLCYVSNSIFRMMILPFSMSEIICYNLFFCLVLLRLFYSVVSSL